MTLHKIQHSIQDVSGLSKDRYVNSFYAFNVGVGTDPQLLQLATAVKAFYNSNAKQQTLPLTYYMSDQLRGVSTIKIYNITNPAPPHPPIYEEEYEMNFEAALGMNTPLPNEVACCLSYSAPPVTGVKAASLRGRIYLGPLNTLSTNTSSASTGPSRPSDGLRGMMLDAAEDLKADIAAIGNGWYWALYSPTRNSGPNVAANPIKRMWVDDAWDTQRRRGSPPTNQMVRDIPN